jgi:phosphatidylserine/phosphatidylglycerophosphate/cardiolipin synthase-like enzyme
MYDPEVKSLYLAYFSFSNKTVRKALCDAAIDRGVNITLYIDSSNVNHENVVALKNCSKKIRVIGRGVGPFGTPGAHLQHAKIFLATSMEELKPLHELSYSERNKLMNDRIHFTSSSANMSSNGTALHFENWLFFDAPLRNYIAQQNVCTFVAFSVENDRDTFANEYENCVNQINAKPMRNIKYMMVPANDTAPLTPLEAMEKVTYVQRELLIGIHRLTSWPIFNLFVDAKENGADVRIIYDDDTLRAGVKNGGNYLDMGSHDVNSYRVLRDAGVKTYFMETNYETFSHVFHNKFVVGDRKKLFQGAGNFTSTALNIPSKWNPSGFGNYEQFYYITVPEIADAYRAAWIVLKRRATRSQDHHLMENQERRLGKDDKGRLIFLD